MSVTTVYGPSSALQSFEVPPQCTSMTATIISGNGTAGQARTGGGGSPGSGGAGEQVTFTFVTTPGDTIYFATLRGGSAANHGGPGGDTMDLRYNNPAIAGQSAIPGGGGGGGADSKSNTGNGGNGGHAGTSSGASGAAGGTGTDTDGGSYVVGGGGGGTSSAGGAGGTTRGASSAEAGDNDATGYGGDANGLGGSNGNSGGGGGAGRHGGGAGGSADPTEAGAGGGGGSSFLAGTINGVAPSAVTWSAGGSTNPLLAIVYLVAPNAPTLTGPATNTNIDQSIIETFTWTFSSPDGAATQGSANFRYRPSGTGAWTTVTGASSGATQSYAAAANTFTSLTGQTVEWQVQTVDNNGKTSPWSASSYFTPLPEPAAFIFTSALVIASDSVPVAGTAGTGGGLIIAYRIQVWSDVSGSPGTLLTDSGVVSVGSSPQTSISTNAPNRAYVNGTKYHILVAVAYPANVWTPYTDSGALTASINASLAPTLTATVNTPTSSVTVAITNPGSDPHPPSYNDVYRTDENTGVEIRIATQIAVNGSYTDWLPGFGVSYRYRVVAVTSTGAQTSSA